MKHPKKKKNAPKLDPKPEAPAPQTAAPNDCDQTATMMFLPIRNPRLLDHAKEIAGYLESLHYTQHRIRAKLFGERMMRTDYAPASDLETILREAATSLACALGEARTILDRLEN